MNQLNSVVKQIQDLQEQIDKEKIDTSFEEKKFFNYLGESVLDLFNKYNAIVAGGAISSTFTNAEINDLDVYFHTQEDIAGFISELCKNDHYVFSHTKKASLFQVEDVHIQAIHYKTFEDVNEIFDAFDFTACMGAYDFKENRFVLHKDFLKHNSQRVIRFNKNTDFPLISLMRVKKYEKKGYTISKPELFRIAMTCMNLSIDSYDELKEQIGGMYGVSYDKMFEDIEDEEFSLDRAIDYLSELHIDENRFKELEPIGYHDAYDLLKDVVDLPIYCFKNDGEVYYVEFDGNITRRMKKSMESFNLEEIEPNDLFKDRKVYKYVKVKDGKLISHYDDNFVYRIGETVEAKHHIGLFFHHKQDVKSSIYKHSDNTVMIEAEVDYNDFNGINNGHVTFKKCKILRTLDDNFNEIDVCSDKDGVDDWSESV